MCGIVGVIKAKKHPVTYEEYLDFLAMLEEAKQRGSQATGVIYVFEDGSVSCIKGPSSSDLATDYIPHRKNVLAMLGHTRQSTGGMASDNTNNHPHETKNWALIHNGSCSTSIADSLLNLKTKCDTEEFVRVFDYIEKTNPGTIPEMICNGLDKMYGGWALAFVNKKSSNIYITANSRNPLRCVYFPNGMFLGSVSVYFDYTERYDTKTNDKAVNLGAKLKTDVVETKEIDKTFEPKDNSLFVVSDSARIVKCGEYRNNGYVNNYNRTTRNSAGFGASGFEESYYDGYMNGSNVNTHPINNRFGGNNRPSAKVLPRSAPRSRSEVHDDAPLLYKEEWDDIVKTNPYINITDSEETFFKAVESEIMISKVDFDLDTQSFDLVTSQEPDIIEKFCIYLIDANPKPFDLNHGQAYNLRRFYRGGTWKTPPTYLMNHIDEAFNDIFVSHLMDYIDESKLIAIPGFVWSLLEDEKKLERALIYKTPWVFKVLAVYFGIYFETSFEPEIEDIIPEKEDVKVGEPIKTEIFKGFELKGMPVSPFACANCTIKRKMYKSKDATCHVCPKCGSVIIDHVNKKGSLK